MRIMYLSPCSFGFQMFTVMLLCNSLPLRIGEPRMTLLWWLNNWYVWVHHKKKKTEIFVMEAM